MHRNRLVGVAVALVAIALVAVGPIATVSVAKATPGAQLPDLLETHNLTTLEGRTGRIVPAAAPASVIHFWASWCAPCKKELPLLDDLDAELGPRGVRFAAISIDSDPAKARRFVEQQEIHLPVFLDGPEGLAESLALPSIPSTFVVDRQGRVTFATTGSSEEELARLRAHLVGLVQSKGAVASH
ncbi:MAG: TlpA family protein disulfide reductase [Candidatus Eisenbacteria bacterium]|uniref:TlpA family protein disulfide reductase n=1 Tax=Eiseniibacteriota bacterium TaxID=2212470 RepID=A0A956NAI9_UNCEI|nr:TlpA family protein disulfide reductase [Candidatus Eisenbacteria bacterium]